MRAKGFVSVLLLGGMAATSFAADRLANVDLSSGERIQAGRTLDLEVRRPNHLKADLHSARRNRELLYDGNALTL